jgi:hypothetical protein
MSPIFVAKSGPQDWKQLLGDPESNWRTSSFAKSLARCWEEADGFPLEVRHLFLESGIPVFQRTEFLLAVPEERVGQTGGAGLRQNGIFVLAKGRRGQLLSISVEGRLSGSFGPTLEEWRQPASASKDQRLSFLRAQLQVPEDIPSHTPYQLLDRTASAVAEARRFNARTALMLLHSFAEDDEAVRDYRAFLRILGVRGSVDELVFVKSTLGVDLYCGWARGNPQNLRM